MASRPGAALPAVAGYVSNPAATEPEAQATETENQDLRRLRFRLRGGPIPHAELATNELKRLGRLRTNFASLVVERGAQRRHGCFGVRANRP